MNTLRISYSIFLLLAFYGIVLLVIIGLTVSTYRALRRRRRIVATGLSLLLLASLVLLWPVPIHGGITFLGEILYRELGSTLRQHQRDAQRQQTRDFTQRIAARVAGPLSFTVIQPLSGSWSKVQLSGEGGAEISAWHDSASGLLWSDWLPLQASAALPTLETARERCRRHPTSGYWGLATETENYYLWKADGEQQLPAAPASSIGQLLDPKTRLEMPIYHLKTASNNQRQSRTGQPSFVVRCTARGRAAPQAGYLRKDIPLDQWNRFQMRRMLSGNE